MAIETRSNRSVGGGSVTAKTISFTNNIERYVGRSANSEGRIASTDVIDFDVDLGEIEEPEKFANAVGYIPPKEYSFLERVGATICVGFTSIVSGALDIVEGVVDGVTWVASNALEAYGHITGCEGAVQAASACREFIATSWVDEANKAFYEGTELGQMVNAASYMDYDSDAAKGIRKASKAVGEIALSAVTGGTAAMVIGGLEYAGAAAQSKYAAREDGDYSWNWKDELGIAAAGVGGAMKGKANAALGQSYGKLFGSFKEYGLKEGLGQVWHDVGNWGFVKTAFKNTYTGWKGAVNWVNAGFNMAPDVIAYATGDKELTFKNVACTIGSEAWYMTQTMFTKEFESYVKNPHSYRSLVGDELKNEYLRMVLSSSTVEKPFGDYSKIKVYSPEQQRQMYEFFKGVEGGEQEIAYWFRDLSNSDADKLLKNLTGGDVEKSKEIVQLLAKDILREDKVLTYSDLAQYGNNFQKYLLDALDPKQRENILGNVATEFTEGNIKLSDLRTLFDPKDSGTRASLEYIWENLGPDAQALYGTKFKFIDAFHEAKAFYDEQGQYIYKTGKKVFDKRDTIAELFQAVFGAPPEGEIINGQVVSMDPVTL